MCDACERLNPTYDRRSLLRNAVIGGAAIATGSLWAPAAARAADGGGDDNSGMETASMAEDTAAAASSPDTAGTTGVTGSRNIPFPNLDAMHPPAVVTRAQWGADESLRLGARSYAPIRKLIVHHTASANRPSDPAAVVRAVLKYHATGRGFSDTGYNFLIDHKGVVYEGRAARRYSSTEVATGEDNKGWGVVGAHAKGHNAGSCGICLIGDFDTGSPTDAALASLVQLLSFEAGRHRIDANGKEEYIDIYGRHHLFPNISGHRQVGQTACPGSRLFKLLPTLRTQVETAAGAWGPLVVDIPGVIRYEYGNLRSPKPGTTVSISPTSGSASTSSTSSTSTSTSTSTSAAPTTTSTTAAPTTTVAATTTTPTPTSPSPATSTTSTTTGASTSTTTPVTPGTGTKLTGIRVVSTTGTVYTVGDGRDLGDPASNGVGDVVALANTSRGDGYWALGRTGKVAAFGGLKSYGDTSGKGPAADIVATASGAGYWVLLADGGIYPFGDAGYASSPKKAGVGGTARRMAARPQGDGYWVLMADNTVHAFGNAPALDAPTGAGTIVDLRSTPSGGGYWVLTDKGRVLPVGDAKDFGDLKRSKVKWSKPVARLLGTPTGKGYLIVNSEGSMLAFGDAPSYPSLGGSGITAAGVAPAFT